VDTPEHVLKKAGMALRVRRDEGRWIQNVKTKREVHDGLSLRLPGARRKPYGEASMKSDHSGNNRTAHGGCVPSSDPSKKPVAPTAKSLAHANFS